jgi:dynein heavy chain
MNTQETGKLYVNFDREIFQLIREAKCLVKLEVAIPEGAKMILLQEEKFKSYYNDLKYMLSEYERVLKSIIPITQNLLEPHIKTMELKLRPGMVTLTWTSMNIDIYKSHIHDGLSRLEELVTKVNDIVVNRIQKSLKQISRAMLIILPLDKTITLDEFVTMEENCVRVTTVLLAMKNKATENAVLDLFSVITATPVDPSVGPVSAIEIEAVHAHYCAIIYQALLNAVKSSLNALKRRTCHCQFHLSRYIYIYIYISRYC